MEQGSRPGFPSMHAAGAFAVARCLSLPSTRGVAWLGWLCAWLVAWSRLCLGMHFPSDVLAGAFVGTCCALAAVRLAARLPRWRVAVLSALGRS
ncbi:MAG: phosphatase PAP2 family protein [Burkholderiales bacterium]|nr:phosphatase PAP2 family protein [Burkholderiales bacterium]